MFIRLYIHTLYVYTSKLSYVYKFILLYFHSFIRPYVHTFIRSYVHTYHSVHPLPPPSHSNGGVTIFEKKSKWGEGGWENRGDFPGGGVIFLGRMAIFRKRKKVRYKVYAFEKNSACGSHSIFHRFYFFIQIVHIFFSNSIFCL